MSCPGYGKMTEKADKTAQSANISAQNKASRTVREGEIKV